MLDAIQEVESALTTVQRTLDWLTERGHDDLAFQMAKLQFSASIRASWPGNLFPLANMMTRLGEDRSVKLSDEERAEIARAAAVLRRVCG